MCAREREREQERAGSAQHARRLQKQIDSHRKENGATTRKERSEIRPSGTIISV